MILNYSSVTFGQLADIQCEGLILRSQPAYPTFVVILDRTSFKGQTIDADRKSRRSQQDGVCCQDVCVRGDTGRFRWSKPVNGLRLYEQGDGIWPLSLHKSLRAPLIEDFKSLFGKPVVIDVGSYIVLFHILGQCSPQLG